MKNSIFLRLQGLVGLIFLSILASCTKGEPPEPDFSFDLAGNCQSSCEVYFFNDSKNADGYIWRFGDGQISEEEEPRHTYQSPGTYTVELEAFNEHGRSSKRREITISGSGGSSGGSGGPGGSGGGSGGSGGGSGGSGGGSGGGGGGSNPVDADFDVENDGCEAPCTVFFDNNSENAASYYWEFGDGSTSTAESPEHTYTSPGEYRVKLTARNAAGDEDTATDWVTVEEGAPAFSRATLTKVEVYDMPLYANSGLWDLYDGPDVYFGFYDGNSYINGGGVIENASSTPLIWQGSIPVPSNSTSYYLHFYDEDYPYQDQYMGRSSRIRIQDYIDDEEFPSVIDISYSTDEIGVRVYLEWE